MICWVFHFLINFVGVGQIQEDKVGFLPFNFIRKKLMMRKGSQRRGDKRMDRREQGSGWPQLVPPCMLKASSAPKPSFPAVCP